MTLALVARIALVLYVVYVVAYHREGIERQGSASLRSLNFAASVAVLATLVWAAA